MKPETTRNQLIRKEVLEKASQLFAEKGYEATSKKDIADAVGLKRTSLYYYFKNKEDLLAALVEDVTVFAQQRSKNIARDKKLSSLEKVHALVTETVSNILANSASFRVLDRNENALPEAVAKKHLAAKRAILDSYSSIIQEGIDSGEFRNIQPTIAAFSIIGMINWAAWWYKPGYSIPENEIISSIADFATAALKNYHQDAEATTPSEIIAGMKHSLERLEKLYK